MASSEDTKHTFIESPSRETLWDIANNQEKLSSNMHYLPDSLLYPDSIAKANHVQYPTPIKTAYAPVTNKKIAIFSFFAGAGFLDLGFESRGFKVVHTNEYRSSFLEAYQYARKNMNIASPEYGYYEGSITDFLENQKQVRLSELIRDTRKTSDIIGFIGGPPCPDFSVGGKNKGRDGENGKLSATYIELICQQRPDFYLFENVKGLWKTKRHREFFEEIKRKTQDEYITTEHLTNAIEYGVPQNRERIILLGFRKDMINNIQGISGNKLTFPWKQYARYTSEQVFSSPWPIITPFAEGSIVSCTEGIIQELTVEHWFKKNKVTNHPNAEQYFRPKAGLARFTSVYEGDDSRKSFKRLHRWRYSPTACYGNNEVHLHPYKIRRISVAEALAIQSLPSNFSLPQSMTLTDAFKVIGNGVPYLMAEALAQTILDFLGGSSESINSVQYSDGNRAFTEQ